MYRHFGKILGIVAGSLAVVNGIPQRGGSATRVQPTCSGSHNITVVLSVDNDYTRKLLFDLISLTFALILL
jgi:hypothetical protein